MVLVNLEENDRKHSDLFSGVAVICCVCLAGTGALKSGASLKLNVPGCSQTAVLRALEVTFVCASILGVLLVAELTGASFVLSSGLLLLLLATLGSTRMVSD